MNEFIYLYQAARPIETEWIIAFNYGIIAFNFMAAAAAINKWNLYSTFFARDIYP